MKIETTVNNRYSIVGLIKTGAMGSVYEAVDLCLAKTSCAIKQILPSLLSNSDAPYYQNRFESELRNLAELNHPSIPRVRDFFRLDNSWCIVMDLVRGPSLDEELSLRLQAQTKVNEVELVEDFGTVLDALSYLHTQAPPIVHRDIKPANLIRDGRSRKIKLVDFGLARSLEKGSPQTIVGTIGYSAPEQLVGRAQPLSDLYSVAMTMHHLLSGQLPRSRADTLTAGYDARLLAILGRALEPKASDRYESVASFQAALLQWRQDLKSSAARLPPSSPPVASSWPGKQWAGTVLLGLSLAFVLGYQLHGTQAPATKPTIAGAVPSFESQRQVTPVRVAEAGAAGVATTTPKWVVGQLALTPSLSPVEVGSATVHPSPQSFRKTPAPLVAPRSEDGPASPRALPVAKRSDPNRDVPDRVETGPLDAPIQERPVNPQLEPQTIAYQIAPADLTAGPWPLKTDPEDGNVLVGETTYQGRTYYFSVLALQVDQAHDFAAAVRKGREIQRDRLGPDILQQHQSSPDSQYTWYQGPERTGVVRLFSLENEANTRALLVEVDCPTPTGDTVPKGHLKHLADSITFR